MGKGYYRMSKMKIAIVPLIGSALLATSCTIMSDRALSGLERQAIADSVRIALYDYKAVLDSNEAFLAEYYLKDHPLFDRIELNQVSQYTITFFRDGRAQYEGNERAHRAGKYSGNIGWASFARISYLLDEMHFIYMAGGYPAATVHAQIAFLRVWRLGETEPIIVEQADNNGPIELWGLQRIIEGEADDIYWKAVE